MITLYHGSNVAVDMIFDSVSIGTTFKKKLEEAGVVLCSISEAMHTHADLVKKYLGIVLMSRKLRVVLWKLL